MQKGAARKKNYLFKQIAPLELRKGDLRKLEIVQAAIECLAKQGWARTNYETVGHYCGMKRPHVAYHYPDFTDLIEAAIKFAYAIGAGIVGDYIRDASSGKDQLRAYIEGTFHWLSSHRNHAATVTLHWHLGSFDKRFHALSAEYKKLGTERVFAILAPGKTVSKRHPAWNASVAIHGLLVGRCVEWMTAHRLGKADHYAQATFEMAKRLASKRGRA